MKQTSIKEIIRLEQELEVCLLKQRNGLSKELLNKREAWSREVLAYALQQKEWHLDEKNEILAKNLIKNPVFIGGCPRSGTTLFSNLLDGHPEICYLPSETLMFQVFRKKLKYKDQHEQFKIIANDWLQRLASPTNWGSYFFMGRTTENESPYVKFIIYLAAWWKWVHQNLRLQHTSPIASVLLAYATLNGDGMISSRYRFWLEKSPGNESFYNYLKSDYPDARFIFLLRNPVNVFKSLVHIFKDIEISFPAHLLIKNRSRYKHLINHHKNEDVQIVTYENLVQDRKKTIKNALSFLNLMYHDINNLQTINGSKTEKNSSFSAAKKDTMLLTNMQKLSIYFMGQPVWHLYTDNNPVPKKSGEYYFAVMVIYIKNYLQKAIKKVKRLLI